MKGIKSTHAPPSTHYAPSTIRQTSPLTPIPDIITKPEPALIPRLPLNPGYIATVTALAVAAFPVWAFEKKQDPAQRTRHAYAFHALRKPSPFCASTKTHLIVSQAARKRRTGSLPAQPPRTLSVSPGKKASRKKQPRNLLPPPLTSAVTLPTPQDQRESKRPH